MIQLGLIGAGGIGRMHTDIIMAVSYTHLKLPTN